MPTYKMHTGNQYKSVMKSNYSFELKGNYLYLIISGDYDATDFLSYPKIIREECEEKKIFYVLLNGLLVNGTNISTMERFFLGEEIARVLRSDIKLAVVWPKEHIDKFAETVAINRGGNIFVVDDMEKAKEWLLAGIL
jgi:hypothetical protein